MEFFSWQGRCLCLISGQLPQGAVTVQNPFAPLVFLEERKTPDAFGIQALTELSVLSETEGLAALLPAQRASGELADFVRLNGACRVNTAYKNWQRVLEETLAARREGLRLTVIGLGDVGVTLLLGLKLLAGKTVSQLRIYDPNEAACRRCELELNQILPYQNEPLPPVVCCAQQELFDCDAVLFAASRGVPPVSESQVDVRLVQLEQNREMLKSYARQAREVHFAGLLCQISDPVDLLARSVYLQTNESDFGGLLPEQVQGFGLGVMAARAAYYAAKTGVDFTQGRVYGPHGSGLIAANAIDGTYNEAVSARLTEQTVTANLRVRELGFKPYIAPGLSSACVSVLQTLTGQWHYGAVPLGGVYFGCRSAMTGYGLQTERLPLPQALQERLFKSWAELRSREEACRL